MLITASMCVNLYLEKLNSLTVMVLLARESQT